MQFKELGACLELAFSLWVEGSLSNICTQFYICTYFILAYIMFAYILMILAFFSLRVQGSLSKVA